MGDDSACGEGRCILIASCQRSALEHGAPTKHAYKSSDGDRAVALAPLSFPFGPFFPFFLPFPAVSCSGISRGWYWGGEGLSLGNRACWGKSSEAAGSIQIDRPPGGNRVSAKEPLSRPLVRSENGLSAVTTDQVDVPWVGVPTDADLLLADARSLE